MRWHAIFATTSGSQRARPLAWTFHNALCIFDLSTTAGEWQNDMRHGWGRLREYYFTFAFQSWMVCPQACLCCADPVMVNCAVWADGNTYEGGWKNDNISPGTKGLGMSESAASRATEREKHSVVCNREPTSLIPAVCVSFVQSSLQCKVEPRLA